MTDLEKRSKKELLDIIEQLRDKIQTLQQVEVVQDALGSKMNGLGFSVIQDPSGSFKLLEILFDFKSKTAKIDKVNDIHPSNYEFALFQAKKFLVESIMNKDNLNHLKEESNG